MWPLNVSATVRDQLMICIAWGVAVPVVLFIYNNPQLYLRACDCTSGAWKITPNLSLKKNLLCMFQVCLSFNPQSTMLASGSMDRTAKLWDIETGEEIGTMTVGAGYMMCSVFVISNAIRVFLLHVVDASRARLCAAGGVPIAYLGTHLVGPRDTIRRSSAWPSTSRETGC